MSTSAVQLTAATCSRRGCALPCNTEPPYHVLNCARTGCDRFMHLLCCQKFIYGKYNLEPIPGPIGEHAVVCTKKCYNKVAHLSCNFYISYNSPPQTIQDIIDMAPASTPTLLLLPASQGTNPPPPPSNTNNTPLPLKGTTIPRMPWNKDGKLGPHDPNHSERVLIDWLTTPGNYSKFRGSNNRGTRKRQYALQIANKIKAAGVRRVRTEKDVLNKIQYVENAFRSAHDFANTETGAGLEEHDKGSFDDAVTKKCPWYFDLLDCFEDRANARPRITTDEMFNDRS